MTNVVQSLWIGDNISIFEKICILSFMAKGHTFHLYTYGGVNGIPKGVILKNAEEIIPISSKYFKKYHGSFAIFADYFRYNLLYKKGGLWVDMDMICLKSFEFSKEKFIFASERVKDHAINKSLPVYKRYFALLKHILKRKILRIGVFCPNNCLIYCASANSDIMRLCIENFKKIDIENAEWGETGPRLLSASINNLHLNKYIKRPNVFCPIDYWNIKSLIDGSGKMPKNSHALHLWNEEWKREGISKLGIFDENSLIECLKREFIID